MIDYTSDIEISFDAYINDTLTTFSGFSALSDEATMQANGNLLIS